MPNLSQVVQDDHTARMVLSMIVEPDDAVTGRLLAEMGTLEVLRLAEGDEAMPGLSAVEAQVWRAQFERSDARTLEYHLVEAERAGIGTLIPGDKKWPSALDDLGDRRPYVLWTRGTTSSSRDRSVISSRSPAREPRPPPASMWPRSWPPTSPTPNG